MNINKFELAGIGVSVIAMALALFLLRIDSSVFSSNILNTDTQSATIVVSDDSNDASAIANAIVEASDKSEIERLISDDVVLGVGDSVETGDTVSVHYIGTLQNGQQFDNSYTRGTPFEFTVGEGKVIEGWERGIIGMKTGGQRILVVPARLGYGEEGYGPIPKNATLVFAIELLSIE